jgi:hypothetical protein
MYFNAAIRNLANVLKKISLNLISALETESNPILQILSGRGNTFRASSGCISTQHFDFWAKLCVNNLDFDFLTIRMRLAR